MTSSEKKNPLVYLFGKTWEYSVGNRVKIVWFWIMFIVNNSINLFFNPLIWAKIINIVTQEGITDQNIKMLFKLLMCTLLIELVTWAIHGPARLMENKNAFKVRLNYRKHLLKGVMSLPLEWHVDHHSGDTIDKIEKGTNSLFTFAEDSFQIIYAVVQLVISYGMLIYFCPSSSYIILGMTLITVWITMRFDRVLIDQYKELNRSENSVSESVFDAISNISTVIILRVERLIFQSIIQKVEKPYELFKRNNYLNEIKWFFTSVCCTVMTILVLGMYFWNHIGVVGGVLVGSIYLLMNYLEKISVLFFRFTEMYGEILKRKSRVMNSEELSKDFTKESFYNHMLPLGWKHLKIENLEFSYHSKDSNNLNLEDISLSLRRGEKIAFVGETGSGKTTLLKVMRDLYHPRSMRLSIDSKVVSHGFEGISQAIALVPQDPEIFATTILDNITLGAEYDIEFVKKFTDMACFTDVAEKLPRKFATSIKEKGINLSGGQQQRLALARGLLACHNKDIVLLDEPTSNLDVITEMNVYQNIFSNFKDKTIVSSVHRLHLLPLFDSVYMFSEGRIVGSGTLRELISSCSQFNQLWHHYIERSQNV